MPFSSPVDNKLHAKTFKLKLIEKVSWLLLFETKKPNLIKTRHNLPQRPISIDEMAFGCQTANDNRRSQVAFTIQWMRLSPKFQRKAVEK